MAQLFQVLRRAEFCETDAAGIVHFSSFFPYMEQAEHALLREVGLGVFIEDERGVLSWPRASAACDYRGPVRFEDLLEIVVSITRIGTKSVSYRFDFSIEGNPVASGRLTTVCCLLVPDQPMQAVPIPERIRAALSPYLEADT